MKARHREEIYPLQGQYLSPQYNGDVRTWRSPFLVLAPCASNMDAPTNSSFPEFHSVRSALDLTVGEQMWLLKSLFHLVTPSSAGQQAWILKKIYIHKMDQRGPHIQFVVRRGRWGFVPPRSPQFKCYTGRHGELRPMKPGGKRGKVKRSVQTLHSKIANST